MPKKYFKNFLLLLISGIAFSNEANSATKLLEDLTLKSVRRAYNLIPDVGRKSYEQLKLQKLQFYSSDNPTIKKLMITSNLPSSLDLSTGFPEPFDQGQLGSCSANALVGAMIYDQIKQGKTNPDMLSRLYLYWQERNIEGTVSKDAGVTSLSDGILALRTKGVCKESLWPYDIGTFTNTPTATMNDDAAKCKDLDTDTGSVDQDLTTMKTLLNARMPIIGGISVYESFESPAVENTGFVPMPDTNTENFLGGHAIVFSGYDDSKNAFFMRNSWGTSWGTSFNGTSGTKGYFWLPYTYATDPSLAFSFWKIGTVNNADNSANNVVSSPCRVKLIASLSRKK